MLWLAKSYGLDGSDIAPACDGERVDFSDQVGDVMEPSPAMGTVPVSVRPVVRGLSAKSGLSASIKVSKLK